MKKVKFEVEERKIYPTRTMVWIPSHGSSSDEDWIAELTKKPSSLEDQNDNDAPKAKKRKTDPNTYLKPEDITEDMLNRVAVAGRKFYDKTVGTSCHQCRQKTLDMKTICRSGICRGVRGNFCGICLENRYGQDARKALIDPLWCCPPCMYIKNIKYVNF